MQVVHQSWYESLVDECRAIIVEKVYRSRQELIEGYWMVGQAIRQNDKVEKYEKGNNQFLATLAKNIGLSERTLYRALSLYDNYPDLSLLPEGKAISWHKLITKYLPNKPKPKKPTVWVCEFCGRENERGGDHK